MRIRVHTGVFQAFGHWGFEEWRQFASVEVWWALPPYWIARPRRSRDWMVGEVSR